MSNVSPGKPHRHNSGVDGTVFDDIDQLWIYVEPFRDGNGTTGDIETVTPKLLWEELKKRTFSSSKVRIMDETTGIPVNAVANMRQAILWVIITSRPAEHSLKVSISLKFERFVSLPWHPSDVLIGATLYEAVDRAHISRENCLEELADRVAAAIEERILRRRMSNMTAHAAGSGR